MGQPGISRLKLNWMNLIPCGTELEIATRGLDAGRDWQGPAREAPLWQWHSSMVPYAMHRQNVVEADAENSPSEAGAVVMEAIGVIPCRRS